MNSDTQAIVKKYVANNTVEEAFKLVIIELRQHVTRTITFVYATEFENVERSKCCHEAILTLQSINTFVIQELMIEILLPRLQGIEGASEDLSTSNEHSQP